jgi:hypothetical protein
MRPHNASANNRHGLSMRSLAAILTMLTGFPALTGSSHAAAVQFGRRQCNLPHDHRTFPVRAVAKPGYLGSYTDPVTGARITRITGNPGAAIPTVGGTWPSIARHNYSKDAAWNANQSLIVLKRLQGYGADLFLDGNTYRPLFKRARIPGETRWHPTRADVMTYVSGSCDIGTWNVRTDARTRVLGLSAYTQCSFGPFEGNLSRNGNRLAVHATRKSDSKKVVFAVDLPRRSKYPDIGVAAAGLTEVDWVSISPLGDLIVIKGTLREGTGDNTKVVTLRGAQVGPLWSRYGQPSHYDLTLDTRGRQVAVGVGKGAPYHGKVIMRDLRTGGSTVLSAGGYASHTSARNIALPGWAFVTHDEDNASYPPYRNEIFAVRLDGNLTIRRLGNVHTSSGDYEAQAHAVPSPDGTRVMFASDWGTKSRRPVQSYVADYRHLCRL